MTIDAWNCFFACDHHCHECRFGFTFNTILYIQKRPTEGFFCWLRAWIQYQYFINFSLLNICLCRLEYRLCDLRARIIVAWAEPFFFFLEWSCVELSRNPPHRPLLQYFSTYCTWKPWYILDTFRNLPSIRLISKESFWHTQLRLDSLLPHSACGPMGAFAPDPLHSFDLGLAKMLCRDAQRTHHA